MTIEPPKTLEDFINVKCSIIELIHNPYSDAAMRTKLRIKLSKVNIKIEELQKPKPNGSYYAACIDCGKLTHARFKKCEHCGV